MASQNTLTFTGSLERPRTSGGTHELPFLRSATIKQFICREITLAAGAVGVSVPLFTTPDVRANHVALITPKPIGLHVGDAAAEEWTCGSCWIVMDTNIDSIFIDNDLANEEITVEVWLGKDT